MFDYWLYICVCIYIANTCTNNINSGNDKDDVVGIYLSALTGIAGIVGAVCVIYVIAVVVTRFIHKILIDYNFNIKCVAIILNTDEN